MTDDVTTAGRPQAAGKPAAVETWINPRKSAPGIDARTTGE